MKTRYFNRLLPQVIALLLTAGALLGDPVSIKELTINDYVKYPEIRNVHISRDGRYVYSIDQKLNSESLRIVDLNEGKHRTVNIPKNNDLLYASWADTSDRILYGQKYRNEDMDVFVYELDSRKFRKNPQRIRRYNFLDFWPANPDTIILDRRQETRRLISHYNIHENKAPEFITDTPGDTTKVICDPNTGWPRIAVTSLRRGYNIFMSDEKRGLEKVYFLSEKDAEWQHLPFFDNDFSDYRKVYDSKTILDLGPDGNTLYYVKESEHGTLGIFAYDLMKNEEIGSIAVNPNYDLDLLSNRSPLFTSPDPLVFSHKRKVLLGVKDRAVHRTTLWADPLFKSIQRLVDKALPDRRINDIYEWNFDETRFLISSFSDTVFTEYYLFDLEKKSLELFGKQRPDIPAEAMGEEFAMRIPLRDGTTTLAYLRLPAGVSERKNLPVVCELPSSMTSRWLWANTKEMQLRAWKGYGTLRLHTRGRPGFGRGFFEKGFEGDGEAIQEDIEDCLSYLIKKGIIDKDRISLYAEGWGAYFCLETMARHPDWFSAAIFRNPLTDINDYLSDTRRRRRHSERWNYFELIKKLQVERGDKESQAFTMNPLLDKIETPIMLLRSKFTIYYSDQYAIELKRALEKRNIPCEIHGLEDLFKDYNNHRIEIAEKQARLELDFLDRYNQ